MAGIQSYLVLLCVIFLVGQSAGNEYQIGTLRTILHEVSGTVYAISETQLRLKNFKYDGAGPDAFFWAGTDIAGPTPDTNGIIIPDENGSPNKLRAYSNEEITITLPNQKKVWDIKWLSIWCRQATVNFGDLIFPSDLEGKVPKPVTINALSQLAHGVRSGPVVVVDTKTMRIPDLHYDGFGPDAFFLVGTGTKPTKDGTKVPDENGSLTKLKGYTGQTVTITLPGELTVNGIDYLSMYCIRANQDFGNVQIPDNPFVPMYYKMEMDTLPHCEQMHSRLNVGWKLEGTDLMLELTATLEAGEYMAFGLSGSDSSTSMVGAQVVVVTVDDTEGPLAMDYRLTAYAQCANGQGACPLTALSEDNVVQVVGSSVRDGLTVVRVKRPIWRTDKTDLHVVWAIGGYNKQLKLATKHSLRTIGTNEKLDFGRSGTTTCPALVVKEKEKKPAWPKIMLSGMDKSDFTVSIGSAGGDRGFTGITGTASWGIAWYLDELLIPELTLKRNVTYTFKVQGGDDPSDSGRYHPFYITDSMIGGKGTIEQSGGTTTERVYQLTDKSGKKVDFGVGRYCEWEAPANVDPDTYDSFSAYRGQLKEVCMSGTAGEYTWTPDRNTPDLLYYQCYTHRFLGWKIHLVDEYSSAGNMAGAASFWSLLLLLGAAMLHCLH